MEKAGSGENRSKKVQRIQKEIENQAAGEVEAYLLVLQKIIAEDILPLEGDDEEEEKREDTDANLLQTAKEKLEKCRKHFK